MKLLNVISVLIIGHFNFISQGLAQEKQKHEISLDKYQFFIGEWHGEGEFSNGTKITAKLTFEWSLDQKWLKSYHIDNPPNKYKSYSFWGVDEATGEFLAYIFDNFNGHRKFISDGWKNGQLILNRMFFNLDNGLIYEQFIFEEFKEVSFKMSYKLSKDGKNWKLIDTISFSKII